MYYIVFTLILLCIHCKYCSRSHIHLYILLHYCLYTTLHTHLYTLLYMLYISTQHYIYFTQSCISLYHCILLYCTLYTLIHTTHILMYTSTCTCTVHLYYWSHTIFIHKTLCIWLQKKTYLWTLDCKINLYLF